MLGLCFWCYLHLLNGKVINVLHENKAEGIFSPMHSFFIRIYFIRISNLKFGGFVKF